MNQERYARMMRVIDEVMDCEPERRANLLNQACDGDEVLRREAGRLLAHHAAANNFLEESPLDAMPGAHIEDSMTGKRIGAYMIVREIGRGGMGAVYEAVRDDDQYQTRVAIKIIKRGMDTDFILRRFRNERQILARLNHPHIARLLDGGTTEDGLPYFVMECIEGQPITEYADERRLANDERLKLFRAVCSAVQYAHQNLVIHRDIKPGNILVTAEGVPKLLDFGIAKLLHPDLSSQATALTAVELRAMTPEYASPEQVCGGTITTASDVYSLGMLLYELLTGRLPYRFKTRRADDIARAVCEQEPDKPSDSIAECGMRNQKQIRDPHSQIRNRCAATWTTYFCWHCVKNPNGDTHRLNNSPPTSIVIQTTCPSSRTKIRSGIGARSSCVETGWE